MSVAIIAIPQIDGTRYIATPESHRGRHPDAMRVLAAVDIERGGLVVWDWPAASERNPAGHRALRAYLGEEVAR